MQNAKFPAEVAITTLSGTEYNKRLAIVQDLRRDWSHETEPEIKHALAIIIIECYRWEKLTDPDMQLLARALQGDGGIR
jgi:hypothetical protein